MSLGWSLVKSSGYINYQVPSIVSQNLQVYLLPSSYSGSGSSWDNVQNGTDATMFNSPSFTSGLGFTFNGTTQYGTLPSVSSITDYTSSENYTIEVWCYISSVQNDTAAPDNCIFEKWNTTNQASYPYVCRYVRSGSTVRFAAYNGSSNPGVTVAVGTDVWVQLVGVFDHTNDLLSMYVNGSFGASAAMVITSINNNSTVNIARRGNTVGGGTNYFTGKIGVIRIYNTALSDSQVAQNFQATRKSYGI